MFTSRAVALAAALTAALPAAAHAAPGDHLLISREAGATGAPANAISYNPSISGNGDRVAFSTKATNLSGADLDDVQDVFARTVSTHANRLVSLRPNVMPWLIGEPADADSHSARISANGRHVVFTSRAANLSDDDLDPVQDVFVRDLQSGTLTLVSRATGGAGDAADEDSRRPSISADGRFVAFESDADNLTAVNAAGKTDVFVRDLQTNTTMLASRHGAGAADEDATHPAISGDGSTVAFFSAAENLSADDAPALVDVFTHTLATGTAELVSRQSASAGGAGQNAGAGTVNHVSLSHDGNRVAFTSAATNLGEDAAGHVKVFVRDRAAQTTTLASRAAALADGSSFEPSLSGDGTRLTFHTYATTFDPRDSDIAGDVYLRDLSAGTTRLLSVTPDGTKGNSASFDADLSADGRFVAFKTHATNLVPGAAQQIVRHEIAEPAPTGPSGDTAGSTTGGAPGAGAPGAGAPVPAKRLRAGRLAFGKTGSRCVRAGRLVIRLKLMDASPGARITSTRVRIGRTPAKRFLGGKARRTVLRGVPGTRVTVRITAKTSTSATLKRTRTYRRCAAR